MNWKEVKDTLEGRFEGCEIDFVGHLDEDTLNNATFDTVTVTMFDGFAFDIKLYVIDYKHDTDYDDLLYKF